MSLFANMASPLSVQSVSKTFSIPGSTLTAVDQVSFSVAEGSIHGLLGPNGAGKSTLIGMISGCTRPSAGGIEVFGMDVVKDADRTKQMMGVVPQEIVTEMAFTVREALYYFGGMYGVPSAGRNKRIDEVLADLHLSDKADERARSLSGGMKRRMMIAKAILHKPKFLILDEPTAGVDVALRQKIWELVRRLNKEEGTTILFTTHYLEEAEQLCDRITLINRGKVVKDGRLQDIQREFSANTITFELFDRNVEHLPEVKSIGSEFMYPLQCLDKDVAALVLHYGHNLKGIRSEAASLEQIFLELTS